MVPFGRSVCQAKMLLAVWISAIPTVDTLTRLAAIESPLNETPAGESAETDAKDGADVADVVAT